MGCDWCFCESKEAADNTETALLDDMADLHTLAGNGQISLDDDNDMDKNYDDVEPPKLIPSIMQLQLLLFDSLRKDDDFYPKHSGLSSIFSASSISKQKQEISQTLKDVSLTVALYTNGSNVAYIQNMHNLLYYSIRINHYDILPELVQLIISFISGISFCDEIEDERQRQQLEFSYSNSIVTFRYLNDDYLNIRSKQQLVGDRICINCCVLSKGDEAWVGLVNRKTYSIWKEIEKKFGSLMYYGGRESSIPSVSSNSEWDNGYGGIHGFGKVIKCVDYYRSGDWITFSIKLDREYPNCRIYKNSKLIFEIDRLPFKHKYNEKDSEILSFREQIMRELFRADLAEEEEPKKKTVPKRHSEKDSAEDDGMYFCVVVDDSNDAFLVEEVMYSDHM